MLGLFQNKAEKWRGASLVLRRLIFFFFLWLFTGLDFFPFLSGDNQVSRGKSSPVADTLWHGCIGEGGADV